MRGKVAAWVIREAGPRIVYVRPPLALVIAQLRYFSGPLSEEAVTKFQVSIAGEYPIPVRQSTQTAQVMATPGQVGVQSGPVAEQWRIASEDDNWVVTLGEQVLSLEVRRYTDFEEFGGRFQRLVSTLIETLAVTRGYRLGLRYINEIRSQSPSLDEVLRKELRGLLGVPAFQRELEHNIGLAVVDLGRGTKVNVQHGLIPAGTTVALKDDASVDKSPFLLLDIDTFQEFKASDYLAVTSSTVDAKLSEFHQFVSAFFRWATTEEYRLTLGGEPRHDSGSA